MNKTDLVTAFEQTSFLYGGNAQFIEQLYGKYLENPTAVDDHWRQFFASLDDSTATCYEALVAARRLATSRKWRTCFGA